MYFIFTAYFPRYHTLLKKKRFARFHVNIEHKNCKIK